MKRLRKAFVIGLAAVAAGVILAVIGFAATFDPDSYREHIEALVRERTGRTLEIGDVAVSFLPRLSVEVGAVRLGQPAERGIDTPFAALERAEGDLRLWPLLLHRRAEVGTLRLHGLSVDLRRRADGTTNWDDLTRLALSTRAASGDVPALQLSDGVIDGAQVHYLDERSGAEYGLRDAALDVAGITTRAPLAIDTSFLLEHGGRTTRVRAHAQARVAESLRIELDAPTMTLEPQAPAATAGLTFAAKAASAGYEDGTLSVHGPRVEIQSARDRDLQIGGALYAQLLTLTGADRLAVVDTQLELELAGHGIARGPERVHAKAPSLVASLRAQTLSADLLEAEVGEVEAAGALTATDVIDAPRIEGRVAVAPFSPRTLLEMMGQDADSITDPAALTRAQLTARYEWSEGTLRLHGLALQLDDTAITGELALDPARPAVRFSLAADRLALDRYLDRGALAGATSDPEGSMSIDTLRTLDAEGTLAVADLTIGGVRATDARLVVRSRDGAATVTLAASKD